MTVNHWSLLRNMPLAMQCCPHSLLHGHPVCRRHLDVVYLLLMSWPVAVLYLLLVGRVAYYRCGEFINLKATLLWTSRTQIKQCSLDFSMHMILGSQQSVGACSFLMLQILCFYWLLDVPMGGTYLHFYYTIIIAKEQLWVQYTSTHSAMKWKEVVSMLTPLFFTWLSRDSSASFFSP